MELKSVGEEKTKAAKELNEAKMLINEMNEKLQKC